MIKYILIPLIAFIVSVLTFYSGFGLGTVLTPLFALFFPLPMAIVSVSLVHFANNLFKLFLVGKYAKIGVVFKFGIVAAITAVAGAYALNFLSQSTILYTYPLFSHAFNITYLGLIIGSLIILASLLELVPSLSAISFPPKFLYLGGALSGFFGGLSGNQGMFRAAFLIKAGLTKEEFIGTSVVISIIIDFFRILVYALSIKSGSLFNFSASMLPIPLLAIGFAIAGSYAASLFIQKMTLRGLQLIVGIMLIFLGILITIGIIE